MPRPIYRSSVSRVIIVLHIFTARNEVGARLCFYRRLWFCPQGGSTRPGTPPRTRYTPDQVHPPRTRHTPRDQVHPPGPGTPPWDQVHPPRTRHTPQDQVPLQTRHTPPGPARYPLGPGTPPPGTRYTPHPGPGTPPHLGPGTPPRTRYTPGTRYPPPGSGTPPWDQVHPSPVQSMLGDTVNARAVRILLECNLVLKCFTLLIMTWCVTINFDTNGSSERVTQNQICPQNGSAEPLSANWCTRSSG